MIDIFCDGGCMNNGSPDSVASWAFIVYDPDQEKGAPQVSATGLEVGKTNSWAELTALLKALEYASENDLQVTIYSDSNYVVQGYTEWFKGWLKRDWITASKQPVKHRVLWEHILALKDSAVEVKWVKAHSTSEGNNAADSLCTQEIEKYLTRDNA